jgi:hypothetical protein
VEYVPVVSFSHQLLSKNAKSTVTPALSKVKEQMSSLHCNPSQVVLNLAFAAPWV